jgi:hypothetical protein
MLASWADSDDVDDLVTRAMVNYSHVAFCWPVSTWHSGWAAAEVS